MNALKRFQPIAAAQFRAAPMASRFAVRSFSASALRSYEYIEVSEPRPGVGQGMCRHCL